MTRIDSQRPLGPKGVRTELSLRYTKRTPEFTLELEIRKIGTVRRVRTVTNRLSLQYKDLDCDSSQESGPSGESWCHEDGGTDDDEMWTSEGGSPGSVWKTNDDCEESFGREGREREGR